MIGRAGVARAAFKSTGCGVRDGERKIAKTIVIVGVGPQIGMSLARRFGREGYNVGLISRSQPRLDGYVTELAGMGIEAAGHAADVNDRPALTAAIGKLKARFGAIDVLEYSPLLDMFALVDVLNLDVERAQEQIDLQLMGAITAVRAVLDEMTARGDGALLFTLGASAYLPAPSHANAAVGVIAVRQYALMLHSALRSRGVYVGSLAIARRPEPEEIAETFWQKVQNRGECETLFGDPRMFIAYEELVARGLANKYPPGLTGELPKPRSNAERELFLVCLAHITNFLISEGGHEPEIARLAGLARDLGGDTDKSMFGADLDKVLAPVLTVRAPRISDKVD